MPLAMTRDELQTFLTEVFPQVSEDFVVEAVSDMAIKVRRTVGARNIRPGGTISGPTMFSLADVAVYLATLAMIGPKALAVTTNASIDFMRKPAGDADLIAECRLLKLGRSLSVGDVLIYSDGSEKPVARASMTYSIPPER